MGSFGISAGNITGRGKKKKNIDYMPNHNSQMLTSATSKGGLNREGRASLLRVRTRPECPEDNLKELM